MFSEYLTELCKYEVYNFPLSQCVVKLGFLRSVLTVGVDQFKPTQMMELSVI